MSFIHAGRQVLLPLDWFDSIPCNLSQTCEGVNTNQRKSLLWRKWCHSSDSGCFPKSTLIFFFFILLLTEKESFVIRGYTCVQDLNIHRSQTKRCSVFALPYCKAHDLWANCSNSGMHTWQLLNTHLWIIPVFSMRTHMHAHTHMHKCL